MKRSKWNLALVAVVMAVTISPLAAQAQSSDTAFSDSIDVRVVNIEAVVTDRNGVRVFGLSPEDFRLLVDGEEVPIEFFTEYRGGEALRDVGASPWEIAPISDRQASGTSYLVFVDDFFSIANDRNRVLLALESQLPFLEQEDRMAIVAWDGKRLEMMSTWSSSDRQLKRALRKAVERPAGGLRRFAERRNLLLGTVPTQPRNVVGGRPLGITERIYVERLTDEIKETVGAAAATLRGFAAPPGRKVMLLVSGGWPWAPADFVTGDPVTAQLDRHFERGGEIYAPVIETANLLGYTLYPIDAPGLQAGSGVSAAEPTSQAAFGPRSLDFFRELELHDSLNYLARETGGRALINGQRQEPLSRVVADIQSFYWLGFTPQRTGDGEVREIQIEMRSPELEVRSRSGYRDLSLAEEITMQVESTLLFGSPAHTGQLVVEIGASQELKRKTMLVPLKVRLPATAVALLPAGQDRFSAELEVRIAAIDDRGDRSEVITLPWRVIRSEQPADDEAFEYATAVQLRRRSQDLVVSVYDTKTGALFSSSTPVVPVT